MFDLDKRLVLMQLLLLLRENLSRLSILLYFSEIMARICYIDSIPGRTPHASHASQSSSMSPLMLEHVIAVYTGRVAHSPENAALVEQSDRTVKLSSNAGIHYNYTIIA